jgi:hypothetical protein
MMKFRFREENNLGKPMPLDVQFLDKKSKKMP